MTTLDAFGNLALVLTTLLAAAGQTPDPVRMAPLPRIMDFKAQPPSIKPGESAILIWATENPDSLTIDPAPGRVTARGSTRVSPKATTTYTLTVRGAGNATIVREVTVTVAGSPPMDKADKTAAPPPAVQAVQRMPDGRPDLSGVYNYSLSDSLGNARGTAPSSGPQLKPGMESYREARPENDPGALSNCMPIAGPLAFTVPYPFQIIQSAAYVIIFHEFPGVFRIVPTTGVHSVDPDPTWLGESIGRWDKDTLVVDTIGFNTRTELSGFRHSEKLHVVERFSRPDFNTLHYEATLEDSEVFVRPWTVVNNFRLRPELNKIDEFVCENKKDYSDYFEKK
jgi:hypothetical protein